MEVIERKAIHCPLCGYTRTLMEDEEVPAHCPACGDGRQKAWFHKEKRRSSWGLKCDGECNCPDCKVPERTPKGR